MAGVKTFWWFLFLLCCLYIFCIETSHIEIDSDGGYRRIVIAMTEGVEKTLPYSHLKTVIERFFHDVSDKLYDITRKKVFFKEIHVLLPSTWQELPKTILKQTFETYQEADIRLDAFNPSPENSYLHTQHPRGCGKRGNFIYLNPNLLIDWRKEKSKSDVKQFVQEWLKFRYGFCEPVRHNDNLCLSNTNSTTTLDHRSQWKTIKTNDDFKKIQSRGNQTVPPLPVIKYVKFNPINVVLVIDPLLLQGNVLKKSSHMLALALRQFIKEFPVDGQLGFVIADEEVTSQALEMRSHSGHQKRVVKAIKNSGKTTRNLSKGIQHGIEMLTSNDQIGQLVLFADGANLNPRESLPFVFSNLHKLNFFLLTWTAGKDDITYSPNEMRGFIDNPLRSLWVDIKMKSDIGTCDLQSRVQVEDAFRLFFAKFGMAGFYPPKIKIQDFLMTKNEVQQFVVPYQNAEVEINIYSCDLDYDNQWVSLHVHESDLSIDIPNVEDLSCTQVWRNIGDWKTLINFSSTFSSSNLTATSLWLNTSKEMHQQILLDAKIEKMEDNSSLVIYSYNPYSDVVVAEISNQNGWNTTFDLRDNGNGDPDVIAGDKIHSRYFVDPSTENQIFSIIVVVKDEDDNIIAKTNLGTVYLQPTHIYLMPPSRIGDFRLKYIDEETHSAVVAWTAPGGNYDSGSALAYNLMCTEDIIKLTSIKNRNYQLEKIIPLESGREEMYQYSKSSSLPFNIMLHCALISKNRNNIWSNKSNIISICIPSSTSTTTSMTITSTESLPSTTEVQEITTSSIPPPVEIIAVNNTVANNTTSSLMITNPEAPEEHTQTPIEEKKKFRLSTGGIIGIIVGLLLVIVLAIILVVVYIKCRQKSRFTADKSRMNETYIELNKMINNAPSVENYPAIITMNPLTSDDEGLYENVPFTCATSRTPKNTNNIKLSNSCEDVNTRLISNISDVPKTQSSSDIPQNCQSSDDNHNNPNAVYATIDKKNKRSKSVNELDHDTDDDVLDENDKQKKKPPAPMPRKINASKSGTDI